MQLYGGIEAGGTKFVCAVGSGTDSILDEERFRTTSPEETLGRAADFFERNIGRRGRLAGLGVSCFGPVDPDPRSTRFGWITSTPKQGWIDTDVLGFLRRRLGGLIMGFDTDVNGAALGEQTWGAALGKTTFIYLTVGTGIGGGGMAGGALLHGLIHPEMGHVRIPHELARDPYPGHCPYHGDCLEGLACGPAIEARWGCPARELSGRDEVWDLEAEYLAMALVNYIVVLSPELIILGGGVMDEPSLLDRVRTKTKAFLGNYLRHPAVTEHIADYIVRPALGGRAGVLGAMALAMRAAIPSMGKSSP